MEVNEIRKILYIVTDTFEYTKVYDEVEFNLKYINNNLKPFVYSTILNGDDMSMIRNYGGTVLCGSKTGIFWLINPEHVESDKGINSVELLNTIKNIRDSIKRDLRLNTILK